MKLLKPKEKKEPVKKIFNAALISKLQPQGNLRLDDERYIKTGDGYCSCIMVYEYPAEDYDFWLERLLNIDGVYCVLDVATEEKVDAEDEIISSLNELDVRYSHAQDEGTSIDAEQHYKLLRDMLTSVKTQGEVIKLIQCRLYVSGRTKAEVDERVAAVIKDLESDDYRAAVFLSETEFGFKALFQPYHEQIKERNKRVGNPLPAISLAGGYPFNFEMLDDPFGIHIGSSSTRGNIIFDQFRKTKNRLSYDTLIIGKKGSGKSTLMKLLMKNNAIIGNFIRVIDVTGEFSELAKALGGKIVTLNGSEGIINYLEVFRTDEDEAISFANHLSKLNTFYKFMNPAADEDDRNEFEEYVRRLYEVKQLWLSNTTQPQKITGLPPQVYPTFSDLLDLVRSDLYIDKETRRINPNLSPSKWRRLESIELTLSNLVHSYGKMFDGHTSLPDLTGEQIIVYNVQSVSNFKSEIFNALLFNVMSMMLDDMIRIGAPSKKMYEDGTPIYQIPKLLLMIDEAHKFINTRNPLALDYMISIMREGRKYFTGLTLASQSIRDFAPQSNDSEAVEKLKLLFELTQYKFIMQQESNCLPLMRTVFEDQLTESQLKQVPKFGQGECFLLTGEDVLHTYIEITEQEKELFKGGA
ncbi:Type IV secretion system protein VirB4 [Ruminococcaceae bacterium BL-6]|nr:Type IV secretion system protein VirB4 [Ruminococcaceae bacterium BL-6]